MNTSTRFLLATGLASLMGLTFLAPSAYAQDAGAPKDAPPVLQLGLNGDQGPGFGPQGDRRGDHRGGRGGIAGLICSTDGATQLETQLADLGTTLKLTATQQPLFDAYKTAALSAQTSFAEACPQPQAMAAQQTPDAVTMLEHRVARQTAELEALNAVLPSFEALYTSLDDTQKAALMPLVGPQHGGPMGDDHRGDRGDRGDRAGRHDGRGDRDGDDDRGGYDRGNDRGRGEGRHD